MLVQFISYNKSIKREVMTNFKNFNLTSIYSFILIIGIMLLTLSIFYVQSSSTINGNILGMSCVYLSSFSIIFSMVFYWVTKDSI